MKLGGPQSRNTHIGVAFLKMLMCFEVVCCHYRICKKEYVPALLIPIYILKDCAVCVLWHHSFTVFIRF